nr:skin secretory protein xP2-like [Aegilops tauschii subsp. strangulata]
MSYHRGSSNAGGDDDAPSAWSSSLGNPETAELCRKVYDEVIAAFRPAAAGVTPDLTGESGRLCAPAPAHGPTPRERRRGAADHQPAPPVAVPARAPAIPPAVELPPEQVVLRKDGDPDNTPGWHVALWASEAAAVAVAAATREAAEVAAAIEAAAAMAAEEAAMVPAENEEAAPTAMEQ